MGTVRIRTEGVVWQQVEDEVVVLDTASSLYYGVTGSGAQLWPLVVAGASREALADRLVALYGIGVDAARADVDTWVAGLAPLLEP